MAGFLRCRNLPDGEQTLYVSLELGMFPLVFLPQIGPGIRSDGFTRQGEGIKLEGEGGQLFFSILHV